MLTYESKGRRERLVQATSSMYEEHLPSPIYLSFLGTKIQQNWNRYQSSNIMLNCLNFLTELSYLFLYFAALSSEYETWPVIYKSGEKQMANLLWYNEGKCFSVKSKLQKRK